MIITREKIRSKNYIQKKKRKDEAYGSREKWRTKITNMKREKLSHKVQKKIWRTKIIYKKREKMNHTVQ